MRLSNKTCLILTTQFGEEVSITTGDMLDITLADNHDSVRMYSSDGSSTTFGNKQIKGKFVLFERPGYINLDCSLRYASKVAILDIKSILAIKKEEPEVGERSGSKIEQLIEYANKRSTVNNT